MPGVPVERPRMLETTARGAAFLAGIAVGLWDGPAAAALPMPMDRFAPDPGADRGALLAGWHTALGRALT